MPPELRAGSENLQVKSCSEKLRDLQNKEFHAGRPWQVKEEGKEDTVKRPQRLKT